jgi:hypothetical protein
LLLRDCAELLKVIRTAEPERLQRELVNKESSPWQGWGLTTYQMKQLLKRYGIKQKSIRTGGQLDKGFHLNQFEDALLRYECGVPLEEGDEIGHNGHIFDNKNNNVPNVPTFDPPQNAIPDDDSVEREERAATLEYDGGLTREVAEVMAVNEIPPFLRKRTA